MLTRAAKGCGSTMQVRGTEGADQGLTCHRIHARPGVFRAGVAVAVTQTPTSGTGCPRDGSPLRYRAHRSPTTLHSRTLVTGTHVAPSAEQEAPVNPFERRTRAHGRSVPALAACGVAATVLLSACSAGNEIPADWQPLRHRSQRRQIRWPPGHLCAHGLCASAASTRPTAAFWH